MVKFSLQGLVLADDLRKILDERINAVALNVLVMKAGHSEHECKLAKEVCFLLIVG